MAKYHPWRSLPPITDIRQDLSAGMRSAARPLRVLEFFDEIRRPARALEIADRLDLPQSTTSVLLKGMVTLGYLDYDVAERSYQPCLRVSLLGSWRDKTRLMTVAVVSMLEALSERTGLPSSLSSRNGIFLRYVHIVQQGSAGQPHMMLSARRYAVWSASGTVLLGGLADGEVRSLLHRTLAEADPSADVIVPRRVHENVDLARRQGYFAETGLVTPNMRSISMLLTDELSGYGAPLALTLSNTRLIPDQTDEALASVMTEALAKLAG